MVLARQLDPAAYGTYKQFFLVAVTVFLAGQSGLAASLYCFVPRAECDAGRYAIQALACLFVLGGLARRKLPDGRIATVFESGDDLVRKTPGFYVNAMKRLDQQLNRAYVYAERHFGGPNPYLEEMDRNMRYARVTTAGREHDPLRRTPPITLPPGLRGRPGEAVIIP